MNSFVFNFKTLTRSCNPCKASATLGYLPGDALESRTCFKNVQNPIKV
jgi:hypothetical protein